MKYCIGAAQFGLDYGLTNEFGKMPLAKVRSLLEYAQQKTPFDMIDTAHLYGDSESVLGRSLSHPSPFAIMTKSPYFEHETIKQADRQHLKDCLNASLRLLDQPSLYAYMIHRGTDLLKPNAEYIIECLELYKDKGLIGKIGISAYDENEVQDVLHLFPQIELVQLPINLLDQNFFQSGALDDMQATGIEIHARSIFLQGLILADPNELAERFNPLKPALLAIHEAAVSLQTTPLALCINYIKKIGVDGCIIGMSCQEDLVEINHSLKFDFPELDYSQFAVVSEPLLKPSNW